LVLYLRSIFLEITVVA